MVGDARQKTRRERELEQKREELASLRSRHAEACAALHELRDEVARFERDYDQTLGRRMAELEQVEAEIALLTGQWREETEASRGRRFRSWTSGHRHNGADSPPPRPERPSSYRQWQAEEQDMKSLYREVAKAVHPDLADSGPAQILRNELMSKANRAYAADDRRTLQEILRQWGENHNLSDPSDRELHRMLREIARMRAEVQAVEAQVAELKGSFACRFKLRAEAGGAGGGDLFAELVAVAELNLARALRRLADLRLKLQPEEQSRPRTRETRRVAFPDDMCCGELYIRERHSQDYSQWKRIGPAIGTFELELAKALRLDVREQVGDMLCHLQQLEPYDLQALFLYDLCDEELDRIVHLTGLEELYISGARLTDAALLAISTLTNLKRIYIYQTSISDRGLIYLQRLPRLAGITSSGNGITEAGLAGFERALPRVKTVSFKWRR